MAALTRSDDEFADETANHDNNNNDDGEEDTDDDIFSPAHKQNQQSRSGGKLSEVLEKLADTIRDSAALRGDVRAISANGRLTGSVLTILPVAIAGIMFITSPDYIATLIAYPQGKYLLMASIGCLVLGHFVIRKIVNIKT